jgi:hypothetical protein
MKRFRLASMIASIFVLLFVTLTLAGCFGGGGGKGYTVSGKVTDEDGIGIAEVQIAVKGGKSKIAV